MSNTPLIFWLVPVASLIALGFAWHFFRSMMKESEGTPRMKEIAAHVRKGAMAYLRQQYRVVAIVFLILVLFFAFLAYGLGVQNPWVPFAFLTGGLFSGLAGFIGMRTATFASARTAHAASQSLNKGLKVAFRSGAVMGLVVVGLGLLDISVWYLILNHFIDATGTQKLMIITTTMLTFGMGLRRKRCSPAWEEVFIPKRPTWAPTWSVRWKPGFRKTIRATPLRSPTT